MKKFKILDSFYLKIIALITMFIDHFAATVLSFIVNAGYGVIESSKKNVFKHSILQYISYNRDVFKDIIFIMRIIGRIAFPIYCFLLVQGFIHTKSKVKYVFISAIGLSILEQSIL